MKLAKEHFEQNIARVKNLGFLHKSIFELNDKNLDLSDILRAQHVMLVSALDHFIHEIVRIGMLEIYNNKRKITKEFEKFIHLIDKEILLKKAILEEKNDTWLNYQIRYKHGLKSFQQAEKIDEAILLIDPRDLWAEIAKKLSLDKEDLKKELNLIISRRNQIAHEADIEPQYKELREIKIEDVNDSILFVETIVSTIFFLVIIEE